MTTVAFFILAAAAEVAGCFSVWAWTRQGHSAWWLAPGMVSLAMFAWALTRIDAEHAGRSYAAYGGVYIVASLLFLWAFEGVRPDRWDIIGGVICLCGASLILFGRRVFVGSE